MNYSRGDCGHIKAQWDNHYSYLSCTSCSRISTCFICSQWSDDVWILAEKRRLHATRRPVMTNRRQNIEKNRNVSDSSDTISLDGKTILHGFTARGRTHLGGSQMETISNQAISPPVTGQPGTGQPVTGHLFTGHLFTGHPGTSQPVTGHWSLVNQALVNQSPVNQAPVNQVPVNQAPVNIYQAPVSKYGLTDTGHQSPGIGQLMNYQHSPVFQLLVFGLQSSYPASISSHHSRGSERRLPRHYSLGSEHSFAHELPNPATSSKMILPLEPDFSQMSDPCYNRISKHLGIK